MTFVVPKNEMNAYIYEKSFIPKLTRKQKESDKRKVKQATFDDNGNVFRYYGGSLQDIIREINNAVVLKNKKQKREKTLKNMNLLICVCVQDGCLMDIYSYQNAGFNFDDFMFDNIFFVTPLCFLRYWTLFDVFYRDTRIEVKQTSYYHPWNEGGKVSQARYFGITKANSNYEDDGGENKFERQNDIYGFCLILIQITHIHNVVLHDASDKITLNVHRDYPSCQNNMID